MTRSSLRRMRLVSVMMILLSGCVSAAPEPTATNVPPTLTPPPPTPTTDPTATLFEYDSSMLLGIKENKAAQERDDVTIYDIQYDGLYGTPVPAYLVIPAGDGPFPAILYAHWLGSSNSDRREFLDEAVEMAQQGFASLLPNQFFPWTQSPRDAEQDRSAVIQQVIALRRGLDVLVAQPYARVDSTRIAFVGHDYGAMYGSIVAGVDDRIKALVLMAPTSRFANWNIVYWHVTTDKAAYQDALKPLDPIEFMPRLNSTALFFQFATSDQFIRRDVADEMVEVAGPTQKVAYYDAGHPLNHAAREDRIAWLVQHLNPN